MWENTTMLSVPVFKGDNYEMYKHQTEVCGLEKAKQASVLWLTLPDEHVSDIKANYYNKIKDKFKTKAGLTKFLEVMPKAFKPVEQNKVMKAFLDFFVNLKGGARRKL